VTLYSIKRKKQCYMEEDFWSKIFIQLARQCYVLNRKLLLESYMFKVILSLVLLEWCRKLCEWCRARGSRSMRTGPWGWFAPDFFLSPPLTQGHHKTRNILYHVLPTMIFSLASGPLQWKSPDDEFSFNWLGTKLHLQYSFIWA
jgi:hypothetical protein